MAHISKKQPVRIGIIGLGNIGTKRFHAIEHMESCVVVGIFDVDATKAAALAAQDPSKNIRQYDSCEALLADKSIDAVIISTPPHITVATVRLALKAGKHVLAEKPLGNTAVDAKKIASTARKVGKVMKVGFNHRHHPALMKAYRALREGVIGDVMYIAAMYGHGGRKGYGSEWRMQKKFSRGGELFDQGVHIIDLANWFVGGFNKVFATTRNSFWKESDLEDNAFCQLMNVRGQVVNFHVSTTQWKNRFSFEIYGTKGYLFINGLGRSYGIETLKIGVEEQLGRPYRETVFEFPGEDVSWRDELEEFVRAIGEGRESMASGKENVTVMKLLDGLYRSARMGKIITIR